MKYLIWRHEGNVQRTPLEHAWHHALCCILPESYDNSWWAGYIVEQWEETNK